MEFKVYPFEENIVITSDGTYNTMSLGFNGECKKDIDGVTYLSVDYEEVNRILKAAKSHPNFNACLNKILYDLETCKTSDLQSITIN